MIDSQTRAKMFALARARGFRLTIADNPMHPMGIILLYEHPRYPATYNGHFEGGHEKTWIVRVKNWESVEWFRVNTPMDAMNMLLEEWRKDVERGLFP